MVEFVEQDSVEACLKAAANIRGSVPGGHTEYCMSLLVYIKRFFFFCI